MGEDTEHGEGAGGDDPLADEFDVAAAWTADSVERLGPDHAVPAACRGSGGPGAMAWLAAWLRLAPSGPLLDVGGGLGGPAAWAAAEHGVRPVLAEPMFGAVAGARRLFAIPAVVAVGERLPLATSSFPATWALGVLSTTPDKAGLLGEMRRVLGPGGRAGLVEYLAEGPVHDAPEGNAFPQLDELLALLDGAGFAVAERVPLSELPATPDEWRRREDAANDDVARHHRDDLRWQQAHADEEKVAELIGDGRVVAHAVRLELAD